MTYIDGFLLAVPTTNREAYRRHAEEAAVVFKEHGALSLVECWGDDVPEGKINSMHTAVLRKADETVVFAWIAWPDKATRDAGMKKVFADPRMPKTMTAMPYDGRRMIFGGFELLVGEAAPAAPSVQPYLFFRGRCEEAIEYYKATLGAEILMLVRFKENPDRPPTDKVPAEFDERIMHASLRIQGTEIMMSDGMKSGPLDFQCMSLTISVRTEADAERLFNALAADGTVEMPLAKTFFSPSFGAVVDKFGVSWMVMV